MRDDMRLTRRPAVPGGPHTLVGLWLRASLRGDKEDYTRRGPTLNRGEKGWNKDEPAVVEAACQIAVRQYFSAYHHVTIDVFVADMRRRISAGGVTPSHQEDMEAVIRAALDDTADVPPAIKPAELFRIRAAVTVTITDILKLDTQAIDQFVAEAERIAIARGYSPPMATES
jgi:hypothetical protein